MALPSDLRTALLQRLALLVTEEWPAAALQVWLKARHQTLYIPTKKALPQLTRTERYLRTASWAGEAAFCNQLFLPYGLSLILAAQANNVTLFTDVLLRRQDNDYVYVVVLRQLKTAATAAEHMLAYLLSTAKRVSNSHAQLAQIIDDMILGRIVLTPRAITMILATPETDKIMIGLHDLIAGYAAAKNLRQPLAHIEGDEYYTTSGYLLAGGIISIGSLRSEFQQACATVNYLTSNTPVNETRALEYLAFKMLKRLPRDANRDFSFSSHVKIRDPAILRQRAAVMLTLVPQIYAASDQRSAYLTTLQFILDPSITPAHRPQPELLTMFGRYDLLQKFDNSSSMPLVDPAGYIAALFNEKYQMPRLFPLDSADKNWGREVAAALNQAALAGQLAAASSALFTAQPQFLRNTWCQILETYERQLTAVENLQQSLTESNLSQLPIWQNNFVVQWRYQKGGVTCLGVKEIAPAVMTLVILDHSRLITLRCYPYDYEIWRNLGLVVTEVLSATPVMRPLPIIAADPALEQVAKLLL